MNLIELAQEALDSGHTLDAIELVKGTNQRIFFDTYLKKLVIAPRAYYSAELDLDGFTVIEHQQVPQ